MFYQPTSIREAVDEVNVNWYLPAIQRPYDWGERNKKQEFIYKLFDFIMREYPIGTLIIWKTNAEIPFRHFLEDYDSRARRLRLIGLKTLTLQLRLSMTRRLLLCLSIIQSLIGGLSDLAAMQDQAFLSSNDHKFSVRSVQYRLGLGKMEHRSARDEGE